MNGNFRVFTAPVVLSLIVGIFLAFLLHSDVGAQAVPLDHFKCYQTRGVNVGATVELQDQFDFDPRPAGIRAAVRFCNPAEKTHNGNVTAIANPDANLKVYLIQTDLGPDRQVLIRNQFGNRQVLRVSSPRALAVPARVQPNPAPTGLDHFKCYGAAGPSLDEVVTLKDRFLEEDVRVLRPLALCNPVEKTHDGLVTEILNPDAHLVCYQIQVGGETVNRTLGVSDQFVNEILTLTRPDLICVPSLKLGVSQSSDIWNFVLEDLTVPAGTAITWTNRDVAVHTSTSGVSPVPDGKWDTGLLFLDESSTIIFNTPGVFPYFCTVHPFMTATVTVR